MRFGLKFFGIFHKTKSEFLQNQKVFHTRAHTRNMYDNKKRDNYKYKKQPLYCRFFLVFSAKFSDSVEFCMVSRYLVQKVGPAIVERVFIKVMADLTWRGFSDEPVHRNTAAGTVKATCRDRIPAKVPEDGSPRIE